MADNLAMIIELVGMARQTLGSREDGKLAMLRGAAALLAVEIAAVVPVMELKALSAPRRATAPRRAKRRRSNERKSEPPASFDDGEERPGPAAVALRKDQRLIEIDGSSITASLMQAAVFDLLIKAKPHPIPSREIAKRVWGRADDTCQVTACAVCRTLAERVGVLGLKIVHVRGVGYSLQEAA
jgi:DNA-binding response OmpR family regulator